MFTFGYQDLNGKFVLSPREVFRFRKLRDNRIVTVKHGESIWQIAGRVFRSLNIPRPAGLWWIIADFQPTPLLHDPTLELPPGTTLYIPSDRTITEEIFSESRRGE